MNNHSNQVTSTGYASLSNSRELIGLSFCMGIYVSNCNLTLHSYLEGFSVDGDNKNCMSVSLGFHFSKVFARCTWISHNNAERTCAGKDSLMPRTSIGNTLFFGKKNHI